MNGNAPRLRCRDTEKQPESEQRLGRASSQLLAWLDWPAESSLCLFMAPIKWGAPSGRWRLPIVLAPARTAEAKIISRDHMLDETPSAARRSVDATNREVIHTEYLISR